MEQTQLVAGFLQNQKVSGKKSLRKLPYQLSPYFRYLEEEGLIMTGIGYREAQGYQSWLTALENQEGKARYAARSVDDMMKTVSAFYTYLKQQSIAFANPFADVLRIRIPQAIPRDLPDEPTMDKILDELARFGEKPHLRDRRTFYRLHVAAEVLYASGLRVSELANLQKKDIDLAGRVLKVRSGKGGRDRTAYLTDYAAGVLRYYLDMMRDAVVPKPELPQVFGVRDGRSLSMSLNRHFRQIGREFGVSGFTCHAIRHSLGFHLLRAGCDMRYIQLILGHEDLQSTSIYTKVEKQDLKRELDRCHPRRLGQRE